MAKVSGAIAGRASSPPNISQPAAGSGRSKSPKKGPALSMIGRISRPGKGAKPQGGTKTQVATKGSGSINTRQVNTQTLTARKSGKIQGGGQMGGKLQGGTKTQVPTGRKGSSAAIATAISRSLHNSQLGPSTVNKSMGRPRNMVNPLA